MNNIPSLYHEMDADKLLDVVMDTLFEYDVLDGYDAWLWAQDEETYRDLAPALAILRACVERYEEMRGES
jgi:hypothetical protein